MGLFAKGDLVSLKRENPYQEPYLLDLDSRKNVQFSAGVPLLVLKVCEEGAGWNNMWSNKNYRPVFRAKVMDVATGKLYAARLKSLTKIVKE